MSKVAFITGGSGGLGTDIVRNLVAQSTSVIFTYRSNTAGAKRTEQLGVGSDDYPSGSQGVKVVGLALDLTDANAVGNLHGQVKTILNDWGNDGLDYLINNAGFGAHIPVGQPNVDTVDALYQVHFRGTYLITEALLTLINQGGGIVNVSTGLTRFSLPGYGPYAAMKSALETYTKYLAKELGERGIRANLIAPGAIDNEFNSAAFTHNPGIKDTIAGNTALGRVGKSSDIGKAVAFLCSDAANWITGERLEASGGMFL